KKRSKKQLQQDKVKQELEEKDNQIAELKDKYLRLLAEFDNYKKRSVKEKVEFMKSAAQDTMAVLLPVLDDFDRAKKNAEDENSTEPFSEGVALVYNKLHNSLKQKGLEPMVSNGEVFDPELHEAITEIPAPTEDLKGKIIDTVETGYFLKDKIIRHAKVVVGK
ncbi:MAG: molecular chaperone GrpE, partial [Saprospiraceae bacterium]